MLPVLLLVAAAAANPDDRYQDLRRHQQHCSVDGGCEPQSADAYLDVAIIGAGIRSRRKHAKRRQKNEGGRRLRGSLEEEVGGEKTAN